MSEQKFTGDLAAILDMLPDDFRLVAATARAISKENDLKSPPTLVIEFGKEIVIRMISGDTVLAEREITHAEFEAIKRRDSTNAITQIKSGRLMLPKLALSLTALVGEPLQNWIRSVDFSGMKNRAISWIETPHIPWPKFKANPLHTTLVFAMLSFAAYPSWLVYIDRWLGGGPLSRPYYDTIWNSWEFFSKLKLHTYFSVIFISLCALLLTSLFLKDRAPQLFKSILREETPADNHHVFPVSIRRRRRGRNIMIVFALVLIANGASAVLNDTLPGVIFAIGIFGFMIGRWLIDFPGEHVREVWQKNALPWVTMLVSHFALIFFLSAIYSNPNLIWLATVVLTITSVAVWSLRNRISPIFWILSFALVIHTFLINEWWYAVIGDEYAFYRMAVEISQNQSFAIINADFFRGDYVYGKMPYISSFMQAIFIKVFGNNNFAWRFSSIYFSILGIGFIYGFLNYFISKRSTTVVVLLLTSSQYLIGFGKIGYNNLQAFFAMALVLWAAAWAIRSNKLIAFILLGVAEGFCFYVFPAALYITPLPIFLLLIYYLPTSKTALRHWGIVLLASLITLFPLFLQPDYWMTRVQGTIYLFPELIETTANILDHFTTNFAYAFLSPLYIPIESHFISIGYTDLITAALQFLGFAYLLWRFWRHRFLVFIFVAYTFLLFAAGTTHPNEFPPNTRMFILLPWFALLAAFGLFWLGRQISNLGFSELFSWRVVQVLVAIIIVLNLQQTYVVTQERSTRYYYFPSLFLRTTTEFLEDPINPGNIIILYSPETMHFPSVLEILDLYQVSYNPDQVVGIEEPPGLDESMIARAADPSTLVFVDPGLSDEIQLIYANLLTNSANKLDCPITVLGNVRYHMWYSLELSWLCPPSD